MLGFALAFASLLGCKREATAVAEAPQAAPPAAALTDVPAKGGKKTVRVCIDDAEKYPYSFAKDGEVKGIHVDVAREAIEAAGFAVAFKFLPWKRCIEHEARLGSTDSALSAAWSQARESYLWYPAGANIDGPRCRSPFALICNGPVLLVPAGSSYAYDGKLASAPEPVRVTFGYVQSQVLKSLKKHVDEGPGDEFNVGKMVRDGTGSVLIWRLNLPRIERDPKLRGGFRVVEDSQDLSDGFLPFSRQGALTRQEAEKIWTELKRLRQDPGYMERIADRYPASEPDAP